MFHVGVSIREYKIITELNRGAQGFVYVVEDGNTHKQYVLKCMFIEDSKRDEFEKMVFTWKLLCKSDEKYYFVEYKDHFYEGKNTIVIMEYCSAGDLDTLIKKRILEERKFTEAEIIKLVIEGMSALNAMHSRNFIHRDIKSGNILIGADGKFKMIDFNSSKLLEGTKSACTFAGTLEYAPPEIIGTEEYSFKVDVYSFGVVLYQMMVGKTPFVNERGVNMKDILNGTYVPINLTAGYSAPLVNLVHACLMVDPSQRPTAAEVLELPFIVEQTVLAASAAALERGLEAMKERVRVAEERADRMEKELQATREMLKQLNSRFDAMDDKSVGTRIQARFQDKISKDKYVFTEGGNQCSFIGPVRDDDFCDFDGEDRRIVLLDKLILEGIFLWTVRVDKHAKHDNLSFQIGASAFDVLCPVTLGYDEDTCSFRFHKVWLDKGKKKCRRHKCNCENTKVAVSEQSIIAVEVDTGMHTLSVSVNSTKYPTVLSRIPIPLYLGISGWAGQTFTSLSLVRLVCATPNPVPVSYRQCYSNFSEE